MFESELQAIHDCVQRDAPFGCEQWSLQIAHPLGPRVRPQGDGHPRLRGGKPRNN